MPVLGDRNGNLVWGYTLFWKVNVNGSPYPTVVGPQWVQWWGVLNAAGGLYPLLPMTSNDAYLLTIALSQVSYPGEVYPVTLESARRVVDWYRSGAVGDIPDLLWPTSHPELGSYGNPRPKGGSGDAGNVQSSQLGTVAATEIIVGASDLTAPVYAGGVVYVPDPYAPVQAAPKVAAAVPGVELVSADWV